MRALYKKHTNILPTHLPLYSPRKPSPFRTLKKQSKLFLYMISPASEPRWFCRRVFTRSIGYTAVAPVAREGGGGENLIERVVQ